MHVVEAACEALTDMPPRGDEELDAVSLHNQALMNMENDATQGFEKLQFLLQQNPFPQETFGNLLILYVKYEVSLCCVWLDLYVLLTFSIQMVYKEIHSFNWLDQYSEVKLTPFYILFTKCNCTVLCFYIWKQYFHTFYCERT